MNDLITTDFTDECPTIVQGLRKAKTIFDSIKSFEDIEQTFLKGAGLSKNTYSSYLQSVKQFYEFTNGLNPLQVTAGHIESFYDDLMKKVDRNTARLRIAGLKKFFEGIRGVIPIYTSPFELMTEKLKKKISKTKKGNRTKKALTQKEANDILAYLRMDITNLGLENYAIFYMMVTSGLRADELCQLKWKDIDEVDGTYVCYFIGKGDKPAEQEVYAPALEACNKYFKRAFHREPKPEDYLFYTAPRFSGDDQRRLTTHTLWNRITKVGDDAREEGIIKRNIHVTPHTLRRSYATILYKSGMGIKAIQIKTRHANIETLTKHYIDDSEPAGKYLSVAFAM